MFGSMNNAVQIAVGVIEGDFVLLDASGTSLADASTFLYYTATVAKVIRINM